MTVPNIGWFLMHTESQAFDANATLDAFFGGIATNKAGVSFSAQQMFNAYDEARPHTDGLWVNVNGQPDVVVSFLELVNQSATQDYNDNYA